MHVHAPTKRQRESHQQDMGVATGAARRHNNSPKTPRKRLVSRAPSLCIHTDYYQVIAEEKQEVEQAGEYSQKGGDRIPDLSHLPSCKCKKEFKSSSHADQLQVLKGLRLQNFERFGGKTEYSPGRIR